MYFTEKPAANAHFAVTGPNGSRVDNGWSFGEPKRLDKPITEYFMVNGVFEPRLYHTGFPALVTVAHWPAKGRYTATYLSVASDGEAVRGTLTFDYQGRSTAAPAGWTAPRRDRIRRWSPRPKRGFDANRRERQPGGPDRRPDERSGPAGEEQGDGGFPAWLIPALIVVVVSAIVLVAARRRPAAGGATASRRPVRPAGRAAPGPQGRQPDAEARQPGRRPRHGADGGSPTASGILRVPPRTFARTSGTFDVSSQSHGHLNRNALMSRPIHPVFPQRHSSASRTLRTRADGHPHR
ncbi:hypothetical protein NKG94_12105 [Micromonospora sp. M12]